MRNIDHNALRRAVGCFESTRSLPAHYPLITRSLPAHYRRYPGVTPALPRRYPRTIRSLPAHYRTLSARSLRNRKGLTR